MNTLHRRAAITAAAALLVDLACGLAWAAITPRLPAWHGLYCALADAVTRGGDCPLTTGYQYLLSAIECVTVVPLAASVWAFLTSGLTSTQMGESEKRIKDHFEARLKHHFGHDCQHGEPPGTV